MATPPTTSGSNPTALANATRWGRTGEPGSAFSGLTRGSTGRGRGTARGGRGGRGGRGNGPNRESRPDLESRLEKSEPSQDKPKPSVIKPSTQASSTEKASSAPKPKPPASRRASRSTPAPIVTQISASSSEAQTPSSAPRASNTRRRSQNGKNPSVPPKINPPTVDDNLLRPNRPRLPPVPHSAPIKDAPPHLSNSNSNPFDMRTNIDALVERVRAVAMAENRPSTPGSHIDWAGDDDDSLPDLNEWAHPKTIGTSVVAPAQTISPIIVDGLKPLPEPIIKVAALSVQAEDVKTPSGQQQSKCHQISTNASAAHSEIQDEDYKAESTQTPTSPSVPTSSDSSLRHQDQTKSNKKPLHPSLPPKPLSTAGIPNNHRWTGATPMRTPPFNKIGFAKEKVPGTNPEVSPVQELEHTDATEKPFIVVSKADTPVEEPVSHEQNRNGSTSSATIDAAPVTAPVELIHTTSAHDPLFHGIGNEEGLSASIHAPKAISDSASAPANLSSYPDLPNMPRNAPFTHSRAHTVGRPQAFSRQAPTDLSPRYSRSGYSTPRGSNQHIRTHSTPPAGTALNNHRNMTRPVITGDAISRLARTIVSSTPKSAPAVGSSD